MICLNDYLDVPEWDLLSNLRAVYNRITDGDAVVWDLADGPVLASEALQKDWVTLGTVWLADQTRDLEPREGVCAGLEFKGKGQDWFITGAGMYPAIPGKMTEVPMLPTKVLVGTSSFELFIDTLGVRT